MSIESGKCRLMAYVKDLKYVELDLDGRLCEPDVNFGSRYVDEKKVPKDLKTAVSSLVLNCT